MAGNHLTDNLFIAGASMSTLNNDNSKRVFLLPGEYHVSRTKCEIATLLGSCVSVILKHKSLPCGGMNHYLLDRAPTGDSDKGRYGDTSLQTILWLMKKIDHNVANFSAGIYGGAAVVSHLANGSGSDIGLRNIALARDFLKANRIKITEEDVGGKSGRRVYFDTETGKVRTKIIMKSEEAKKLAQKREDIASRNTKVLIVDDSPLVRKILRRAIESSNGIEVCGEAGDAYEARDLIISTDPDVVSLDIIMPKMDGLKFLKKLSQYLPKPVVICSTIAKDSSDITKKAFESGALAVIDKDSLELYKGMDTVKSKYIPTIRKVAGMVAKKF